MHPFAEQTDLGGGRLPTHVAGFAPGVDPWIQDGRRRSAVCFLFIPPPTGTGEAHLVLTRRTTTVRTHKGQIGFAGGHVDPGDGDPAGTALRELEEELGVPRERVKVYGTLPPMRAITGTPVVPILATAAVDPRDFVPSQEEVDEVITAPWSQFRPEASRPFRFNMFGIWRSSELFHIEGHRVWGLTARIIRDAALG